MSLPSGNSCLFRFSNDFEIWTHVVGARCDLRKSVRTKFENDLPALGSPQLRQGTYGSCQPRKAFHDSRILELRRQLPGMLRKWCMIRQPRVLVKLYGSPTSTGFPSTQTLNLFPRACDALKPVKREQLRNEPVKSTYFQFILRGGSAQREESDPTFAWQICKVLVSAF